MTIERMRQKLAAAKVGDWILVRVGDIQRRYRVCGTTGTVSVELELVGVGGAARKLVDGASDIWLVRVVGATTEGRRVSEVIIERQVGEDDDGHEIVQRVQPEVRPRPIDAIELAQLIASPSSTGVASWVIDRLIGGMDPWQITAALQLYCQSRNTFPGIDARGRIEL